MRAAIIVLGTFAALWAMAALNAARLPLWTLGVPPALSLAISAAAWRRVGPDNRPSAERKRISRLVTWASFGEGVAILVGVNAAARAGRPDLSACIVAAAVGLHFLPLVRWIPAPIYYLTAAGLVALAVLGLGLDGAGRNLAVCGGAAGILWATVASLRRPTVVPADVASVEPAP